MCCPAAFTIYRLIQKNNESWNLKKKKKNENEKEKKIEI